MLRITRFVQLVHCLIFRGEHSVAGSGFVSILMREVGEASAEMVLTEGTVLSFRMLGSIIRQQTSPLVRI